MKNSLRLLLEEDTKNDSIKVGQYKKSTKLSLVSVDDQIDSYLMSLQLGAVKYKKAEEKEVQEEKESSDSSGEEATLAEALKKKSLRVLLNEEDTTVGSDEIAVDAPASSENVLIDIDSFAKHVKEFVNLADERLDIRSVIVNRARNLIKDKHGETAKKEFDRALKDLNLGGESRYPGIIDDTFQTGATGGGA